MIVLGGVCWRGATAVEFWVLPILPLKRAPDHLSSFLLRNFGIDCVRGVRFERVAAHPPVNDA